MMKKRKHSFLLNTAGLLLSAGIAFGGLFLVQSLLSQEKGELLGRNGSVEVLFQAENIEADPLGEANPAQVLLTEEQLTRTVQDLESQEEVYLHEPRQTQLTMAQAFASADNWLENFLMPYLGLSSGLPADLKADCRLWTPWEKVYSGSEQDPFLSYWTVTLSSRTLEAELILHAVSGQVLDAEIFCASPVEYQNEELLTILLWDYADAFALNEDIVIVSKKDETASGCSDLYQSVGTQGVFAVLHTASIAVSRMDPDTDTVKYDDWFSIHLYLTCRLPSSSEP